MKNNLLIVFLLLFCQQLIAQTTQVISASDANIQITGRTDKSDPNSIVFAYPGVSIKAKFEGTAIDVFLTEYGYGGTTTTNYFNVIIDGGNPSVLKLSSSQTVYNLATGLTDGSHTIELFKRTESSVGQVAFKGFRLMAGKKLLSPDALPTRKIEFIGNSITCGYGNESSQASPVSGFSSINENNYKAWGAVAARSMGAQYSCVAFSGRGLYRNNDGSTANTMPLIYDQTIANNSAIVWDHTQYVPDVVVINLGTNDFAAETNSASNKVDSTTFVKTYIAFINKLRTYYPCATIICCVGVMMSDGYPSGAKQWTRIQNYVSSVRDYMNLQGDSKIYYLKLEPQSSPYGEDWHPTAATDAQMASTLTAFISSNVSWSLRPTAPSLSSPIQYAQNATAVPLNASGTALKWYNSATGGTYLPSAPTPSTTTIGTTSYYVTQSNGTCESDRARIDVIVNPTSKITLQAGWNLIGCPLVGSTAIDKALASIWNNVLTIKSLDSFYDKNGNAVFNTLSSLDWGKGYFIKTSADCTLTW